MKVSVLVTFYNQSEYVDDTLVSILEQECDFDFEIIAGDDGSSDGTVEKLNQWKEKYPDRIQVIVNERDPKENYKGPYRASLNRLNLLHYVSGEYFLFLDGDDFYVNKQKLSKQVSVMDHYRDITVCGHSVFYCDQNGNNRVLSSQYGKDLRIKSKDYWGHYYFHPSTLMYRSECLKNLDYHVYEHFFNDNLITYFFIQYGDVYYLDEPMTCYRKNENGIWSGASRYTGVFRNFMDYDLELIINHSYQLQSLSRHYSDFKFYAHNHSEKWAIDPYYTDMATCNRLKMSEYLYQSSGCGKKTIKLKIICIISGLLAFYYRLKAFFDRKVFIETD